MPTDHTSIDLTSIDLTSDAFFNDPYPTYATLRADAPVFWSQAWNAWVVTRYADVMAVLKDAARFSSAGRVDYLLRQLPAGEPADEYRRVLADHYRVGLAHTDPPDHTRLRRLLSRGFTPQMVAAWAPRIGQIVDNLLDGVMEKYGEKHTAGETFDLLAEVAYPLPATVLAEMIGAPTADIGLFRAWAVGINRLFEKGGRLTLDSAQAAYESRMAMKTYITDLAEERRQRPQDDIMSRLVVAEDDDRLTPDELVSTLVTLFVAGHETTTNLISNSVYLLLRHREQWAKLCQDPKLAGAAVEESLRCEPSVPRSWRIAKEPIEMGGQTFQPGDLVFPIIAAANRDPSVFAKPGRFDILRPSNKHLAFGHGIHFCIGAPLARLEATVTLTRLTARLPHLRLVEQPLPWHRDVAIRRLVRLPVQG